MPCVIIWWAPFQADRKTFIYLRIIGYRMQTLETTPNELKGSVGLRIGLGIGLYESFFPKLSNLFLKTTAGGRGSELRSQNFDLAKFEK